MNKNILTKEEREEDRYYHLIFCQTTLSLANKIFKEIHQNQNNSLTEYAFGYALVQYAAPYTKSITSRKQKLTLNQKYIPADYKSLHKEILNERDKLHAHMDISIFQPRLLNLKESNGIIYTAYASNHIIRFNLLNKLSNIIKLVDGTLENLTFASIQKAKEINAKNNK